MRYFVPSEQYRKSLWGNALVLMFLGYVALLGLSNAMLYIHHMDLRAKSVATYYLGSEQDFTQPKSYQGMREIAHFHLFDMGMLIVTLTHLVLMTEFSYRLKIWLSVIIYLYAIADEAGGWLGRFVHPAFAYFKISAFLLLETSLAALTIVVTLALFCARKQIGSSMVNKKFTSSNFSVPSELFTSFS